MMTSLPCGIVNNNSTVNAVVNLRNIPNKVRVNFLELYKAQK